jgi:hypothetical protein
LDGEEKGTGGAEIWFLPEATVVSCSRQKNIIQTVIAGHDGTVKELIGMGDWEVTFKGFLINHMPKSNNPLSVSKQTHRYPREAKKQMEQVFAVNQSMRVYSRILNDLNIHRIVTTELNFPALEGYDNVQPYELKCLSDEDIVLNLSA